MRRHHFTRNVVAPAVQRAGRVLGLDVRRYSDARSVHGRRRRLLDRAGISLVIDGGAHRGEFAHDLRAAGYKGRILSIEPLGQPFAHLVRAAEEDSRWDVVQCALGNVDHDAVMNVSANFRSSSLLDITEEHVDAAPDAATVATENVRCRRLDELARPFVHDGDRVLLKLDVQGTERAALEGASGLLDRIVMIQAELPLREMYRGEASLREVGDMLGDWGYELVGIDPAFYDPSSGFLLQVDGTFIRTSSIRARPEA